MRSDGTLGVLRKVRGSREKAINVLITYFNDQISKFSIPEIFVTHLDCDQEANFIKEQISKTDETIKIRESAVGCVLATHSGPKPIGIAYYIQ